MGLIFGRDYIGNKPPIFNNDERDEYFLIDALGIWIPECEMVVYGLLNNPTYSDYLYKLRNMTMIRPLDLYLDTSFFTARDLVRYLASTDDSLEDLDEKTIDRLLEEARMSYLYSPCSETTMRHSIIELMYQKFCKSVTLVFPWTPTFLEKEFLKAIVPHEVIHKLNITGGTIPAVIEATDTTYTTIITNSIEDIEMMVDNREKYRVQSTLFLLRNHSGNMSMEIAKEDGKPYFTERKMDTLLPKLIDMKRGIPLSQIRFGRFEPELFSMTKKKIKPFQR